MAICIVDDDVSVRESVRELLSSAGMDAEVFASAREFFDRPRKEPPTCLILDIDLPGQSGLELQQELLRAAVDVPIIFLTGHGDIPMSVRAIKAGAVEFFTKPFDADQLLAAIRDGVAAKHAARQQPDALAFGPFRLVPSQQALFDGDKKCRVGSRALDILTALVERAGELVTREELFARAWPDTVVDEANLRVHVGALRKVLGDGTLGRRYVINVPGRGYTFVEPVTRLGVGSTPAPPSARETPGHGVPARLTRMIGREESQRTIESLLPLSRFVSIVGPGGIGKTTLAAAIAEGALDYEHGTRFIELASCTDFSSVIAAVGAALEVGPTLGASVTALRDKQMLVVLDTCEHVAFAAAGVAEALLTGAPRVHVLTTSREPLRAMGESVHHLRELGWPPAGLALDTADALAYPAVQLFVESAKASSHAFTLRNQDANLVGQLCRVLDGCPLAIELAAARVQLLGIRGLVAGLDDCLELLTSGRRTALHRHRTLRAALDWSYALLAPAERIALRRLSVFEGPFRLDAAAAVVCDAELPRALLLDALTGLAAKSLLATDSGGDEVRHRLGHTTRAYAREKLAESGDSVVAPPHDVDP